MPPGSDDKPATPSQITAFLSYSRDDRERVMPIISALEAAGLDLWWDGLLAGGDTFAHTTEAALETAQAVIVAWSGRSIQSHWVRDEATRGRDRGRMVPVSLDGTQPPLGFRQVQYIDLSQWRGKAGAPEFAELMRAIERVAASPASQLSFAGGLPPARPVNRRRALAISGGVAAATLAGLAGWKAGLFGGGAAINSIAVLPFDNLGGDASQNYFSDGLSEELRATLSLNRQLEVAARTSSSSFRDSDKSAKVIAGALHVAFILDGTVRRAGNALRITAQLVDGASGFETWSQIYERKADDVLAIQSEIAMTVADALSASISKASDARGVRIGGTRDARAYDAYLQGLALYQLAASERTDRQALAAFDQAVRIDPRYAAAQAARARALAVIASSYGKHVRLGDTYASAIAGARKAVELAPDMAEGHAALGLALMIGRLDLGAARQPYQRSFELGFGNAAMLTGFADFAANLGQFADARAAIDRAERLDPLNASVFRSAGIVEYAARDFAAARKPLRTALSLNARCNNAHRILGDMALLEGDAKAALEDYAQEPSQVSRLRGLAIAEARVAGAAAGERRLAELVAQFGDNALYQQAQVLAQWGRKDEALSALSRGYDAGDAGLALAGTDPLLDPIRREPGFEAVLSRLGLSSA